MFLILSIDIRANLAINVLTFVLQPLTFKGVNKGALMIPDNPSIVEKTVKKIIEEVTGNSTADIRHEADLVDDLGITFSELTKIIIKIQHELEIALTESAKREILDEAESVRDLMEIVEEEYEF